MEEEEEEESGKSQTASALYETGGTTEGGGNGEDVDESIGGDVRARARCVKAISASWVVIFCRRDPDTL